MLGTYIRQLRKNKNYTLIELADLTGISNPYLSQLENDKFIPSIEMLLKLHLPLDADLIHLFKLAGHLEAAHFMQNEQSHSNGTIDIKGLIESPSTSVLYNGHLLTTDELKRLASVLEALYPHYQ